MSRYTKLKIKEGFGVGEALVQAAQAADLAGQVANENKDSDGLVKAADAWIGIANSILRLYEIENEVPEEKSKHPFGFGGGNIVRQ